MRSMPAAAAAFENVSAATTSRRWEPRGAGQKQRALCV